MGKASPQCCATVPDVSWYSEYKESVALPQAMQKIRLFLASSLELKEDREQFEIFVYRKCKAWFERGIFLHLEVWEDFLDAIGAGGLQSEYN